ncbi:MULTISPECIES: HNH endonuclease family protein [unclassified Leucobacter]|uniref:HNH endonuclease family protein n=1 Tax=unclassified Leucobacter TaxID=2621730 RepID=UPI0030182650
MRALVLAALAVCALAVAGAFVAQGSAEGGGSSASPQAGTGTLRQTEPQPKGPVGADRGASPAPVAERTAVEVLDAIPVKGRAPKTGYDRRAGFGDGWQDPDRNGCDARNDVLRRDLVDVSIDERCRVLSGVLRDPYTGADIDFLRGERSSQAVQIDHVVALSDAWQKGAQALAREQRIAFANDPLNLLAVDGAANSRKGDGDAATWLPPERGFRCEYVARQISVKAAYGLWVTDAEGDAMRRVLASCPDQPAYASALAAAG